MPQPAAREWREEEFFSTVLILIDWCHEAYPSESYNFLESDVDTRTIMIEEKVPAPRSDRAYVSMRIDINIRCAFRGSLERLLPSWVWFAAC